MQTSQNGSHTSDIETFDEISLIEPLTERETEVLRLIADGLTNRDIADHLTLALSTVKWYTKQIYAKLSVNNRTQAVARAQSLDLLQETSTTTASDRTKPPKNNLPAQVTSFIGRQREINELRQLLSESRLVSVTGPAGSGKTRLALCVAAEVLPHFDGGIYFVPFAPISDTEHILWTIAAHVDFQFHPHEDPLEQLLQHLRDRTMLLVIDNFEHLLDGAHLVADILRAAPKVKVLVTSRERLHLYGEANYPIAGLSLPDGATPEAKLASAEAVELFMQRARAIIPDFTLESGSLSDVVKICRLVEGMPLGIELAATWIDVLSPGEIADEIEQSLDILAAERRDMPQSQNSMRAAFARSWNLLTEEQQTVFRRLSVFRGGFTRNAAKAVTGVEIRTLQALVNKSLAKYEPHSGRYQLHELLRQYAEENLIRSGEAEQLQSTHAAYYAEFVAQRWPKMKGREQKQALLEIEADIENTRTAWNHWCGQRDVAMMRKFFHAFWVVHDIRGWYPSGIELFERGVAALRQCTDVDAQAGLGWLLAAQGLFSMVNDSTPQQGPGPVLTQEDLRGHVHLARRHYSISRQSFIQAQKGVQILQQLEQPMDMLMPLVSLFITAVQINEKQVALQAAEACLHNTIENEDIWSIAKAKQLLAIMAIENEEFDHAEALCREAKRIFQECGDNWSLSVLCIEVIGLLEITRRRFDAAKASINQGRVAAEEIDFKYSLQMAYWQLGFVEALQKNYGAAGSYWQKALHIEERVIGGKSFIGFGGTSSSGEWGGRQLIAE